MQNVVLQFTPHDTAFHVAPPPLNQPISTRGRIHCTHQFGAFDGELLRIYEYQESQVIMIIKLQHVPADLFLTIPYNGIHMTAWERATYLWLRWSGQLSPDQSRIKLTTSTIHPISSCLWRRSITYDEEDMTPAHLPIQPPPQIHTRPPHITGEYITISPEEREIERKAELIRRLVEVDEQFGVWSPEAAEF